MAAFHHAFSCDQMAKSQFSVLAGDIGDSSRQLRQGSDGSACPLAVAVAPTAGSRQTLYGAGFFKII
jgi:hypothetical protein